MFWYFLFSYGRMMDELFFKRKFHYFLGLGFFPHNLLLCSCSFCHVGNGAEGISCLKTERNPELLRGIKNGVRGKDLKKDFKIIFIQTV